MRSSLFGLLACSIAAACGAETFVASGADSDAGTTPSDAAADAPTTDGGLRGDARAPIADAAKDARVVASDASKASDAPLTSDASKTPPDASDSCGLLEVCCATMEASLRPGCLLAVNSGDSDSCRSALGSFQYDGHCL